MLDIFLSIPCCWPDKKVLLSSRESFLRGLISLSSLRCITFLIFYLQQCAIWINPNQQRLIKNIVIIHLTKKMNDSAKNMPVNYPTKERLPCAGARDPTYKLWHREADQEGQAGGHQAVQYSTIQAVQNNKVQYRQYKILLLGAGESGKSTFIRSPQI